MYLPEDYWDESDIHKLLDSLREQKRKVDKKGREKEYRQTDWLSERDRLNHFDYLTEGI